MVNNWPRGILTDSDRDLLEMDWHERDEEYSRPNLTQRWNKIGERVEYGIRDFHWLYKDLPNEKREKIFASLTKHYTPHQPLNLLSRSFGFQLLGFLEQMSHDLDDEEFYEQVFEMSINRTLERVSMGADRVDVDVTVDGWAPHDALEEHRPLSSLSENRLRTLLNSERIKPEEYAEAVLGEDSS